MLGLIAFDYVPCNYIKKAGKTSRSDLRIVEHSTSVSSAVLQHMTSLGHDVAFNDPQILAHDNNMFRLGIKETLNIHSYKAYKSLNKNTGSYECALF